MSMLFKRTVVVPVWVIAFGFLAAVGPVSTDIRVLLLLVGVLMPTIVLMVWKRPSPTVAEVLHQVDSPHTK